MCVPSSFAPDTPRTSIVSSAIHHSQHQLRTGLTDGRCTDGACNHSFISRQTRPRTHVPPPDLGDDNDRGECGEPPDAAPGDFNRANASFRNCNCCASPAIAVNPRRKARAHSAAACTESVPPLLPADDAVALMQWVILSTMLSSRRPGNRKRGVA